MDLKLLSIYPEEIIEELNFNKINSYISDNKIYNLNFNVVIEDEKKNVFKINKKNYNIIKYDYNICDSYKYSLISFSSNYRNRKFEIILEIFETNKQKEGYHPGTYCLASNYEDIKKHIEYEYNLIKNLDNIFNVLNNNPKYINIFREVLHRNFKTIGHYDTKIIIAFSIPNNYIINTQENYNFYKFIHFIWINNIKKNNNNFYLSKDILIYIFEKFYI
jgi:hypothetical protein